MTSGAFSVTRRVNAERIVVLGWPRAILLQLAHPLVAAGVSEHSSFRQGGFTAVARLHHTIRAMVALTFGDDQARTAALDGIRAIHRRVNGRLPAAAGIFPAGTPYSAEDPDLVLWVHATLLETIPLAYEHLVMPLSADERDAYCEEAAAIAIELGARPNEVPRTWADMNRYLDRMYASGAIVVSAQAREIGVAVLSPPFAALVAPIAALNRLLTIGLLPDALRREYEFEWSAARARRLTRAIAVLKVLHSILPRRIRLWREAYNCHPET